jgi:patatin-like phospholipase/acyl hydrolase
LKLLAAIEEKMGGEIPIQRFFDLIAGTSAGAFTAIGSGIKDMSVKDLIHNFQHCCRNGFHKSRMPVIIQGLRPRLNQTSSTPHPMDSAIKEVLEASAMDRMLNSRVGPPLLAGLFRT